LKQETEERIERIIDILDRKKAEDIQVFDLSDKDYLTRYVIIATTLGDKHTLALLKYLKDELKPEGEKFLAVEEGEQWTIVDLGDIMIHLMVPSYRAKYNLEEFLESLGKREPED
jgi:ribosome silencing factor RsfS/YbeB/iojap